MSCVAELKASSQKNASVCWKKRVVGIVKATPAKPEPMSNCISQIHSRRVLRISTTGLHSGLITHGRYNQLVYRAISEFEIPMLLYMMTDTVITTTYGRPS